MPLSVVEISFPSGSGGHRREDVLLLEMEVAPVLGALERLQCDRRSVCKFNSDESSVPTTVRG